MLVKTLKQIKTSIAFVIMFMFITGIIYPVFITAISQLIFPAQANGSLIKQGTGSIGSLHIGQKFSSPGYFWGRPSATSPFPYNAANSAGSNLAPSNPILIDAVKQRMDLLEKNNPDAKYPIPIDLVTSSASGLDPHISFTGALYQVPRIAKARNMQNSVVENIVKRNSTISPWHLLGTARVNVLQLNLELDAIAKGINLDE